MQPDGPHLGRQSTFPRFSCSITWAEKQETIVLLIKAYRCICLFEKYIVACICKNVQSQEKCYKTFLIKKKHRKHVAAPPSCTYMIERKKSFQRNSKLWVRNLNKLYMLWLVLATQPIHISMHAHTIHLVGDGKQLAGFESTCGNQVSRWRRAQNKSDY